MKKYFLVIALCTAALLSLSNCGPNQKEAEKQKRTEDSINKLDSDKSSDEADKILKKADSADKAKKDSIELAKKGKGKSK